MTKHSDSRTARGFIPADEMTGEQELADMLLGERTDDALDKATDAFWATFAAEFPEVKTGDFPPDADFAFHSAVRSAVETWLMFNYPTTEDES